MCSYSDSSSDDDSDHLYEEIQTCSNIYEPPKIEIVPLHFTFVKEVNLGDDCRISLAFKNSYTGLLSLGSRQMEITFEGAANRKVEISFYTLDNEPLDVAIYSFRDNLPISNFIPNKISFSINISDIGMLYEYRLEERFRKSEKPYKVIVNVD